MKKISMLVLLLFCLLGRAKGTHLVGGEFEMKHLSGESYEVSMNLYFDALNGSPGAEESSVLVGVFEKQTNRQVQTFTLVRTSSSFIPYSNPACTNANVQTKLIRYTAVQRFSQTLYTNPAGYYMTWERCCRNNTIYNILNPQAAGMVYYMEFPAVVQNTYPFYNSSPVFNAVPADFLCVNQLYTYNFGATDADGDSLVYSLTTPLRGHTTQAAPLTQLLPAPYPGVLWRNGHDIDIMIQGNPPLEINARTGVISVRPSRQGLHVFGIKCEEFRNRRKIGEVRRDFQMLVMNCPTNAAPSLSLQKPDGSPYASGDTLIVSDGSDNCFDVSFTDPDSRQNLKLRIEPLNFSKAPALSVTSGSTGNGGGATISSKLCWTDCGLAPADSSLLRANLIVEDNGCGNNMADTLTLAFLVVPKPNASPVLVKIPVHDTDTVQVGETFTFELEGTDADLDPLSLSFFGRGFEPQQMGMTLERVPGAAFRYRFSWSPDCNFYQNRTSYPLTFILKDESCYPDNRDTLNVTLQLRQVENNLARFLPPNIFTPNNDGLNDYFTMPSLPKDNCDDQFSAIEIFNRWGRRVFKSTDRNFSWDGRDVSDGVYYYLISYRGRSFKGMVTIVR